MATITIAFGPKTRTYTVTAGNLTRLSNWATAAYATIPNPLAGQNGQPATIANPDPVGSAIDAVWAGLQANVKSSEQAASVAAVPLPADIT